MAKDELGACDWGLCNFAAKFRGSPPTLSPGFARHPPRTLKRHFFVS